MIVRNLSTLGAGFEMIKKGPLGGRRRNKGPILRWTIPENPLSKKKAVISDVVGSSVGCRFSSFQVTLIQNLLLLEKP